jgi:hypothetical protein
MTGAGKRGVTWDVGKRMSLLETKGARDLSKLMSLEPYSCVRRIVTDASANQVREVEGVGTASMGSLSKFIVAAALTRDIRSDRHPGNCQELK